VVAPSLTEITPASGPTSGGDLVTLRGTGLTPRIEVRFGTMLAALVSIRREGAETFAHVHTPPSDERVVDVTVQNLDVTGKPVAGESFTAAAAYRYGRPRIVREADLTRLIRALLQELKRQVLTNVSLSVAVDFDEPPFAGVEVTALGKLPALVLSGPRIKPNRFYSTNTLHEEVVAGPTGPEVRRRRPPYTVDVEFAITAASDRAVELLNLTSALAGFFNTTRWLSLERDPARPDAGTVRWELDPVGELQTNLDGKDDVRVFTWGLVIRGFDLDEGLPFDLSKAVADAGAELGVETWRPTP
jgi:hypothetical protein